MTFLQKIVSIVWCAFFWGSIVAPMQHDELTAEDATPFFFEALYNGNVELCKDFLKIYPELVHANEDGVTALCWLMRCFDEERISLFRLLLEYGSCTNDINGVPYLLEAVRTGGLLLELFVGCSDRLCPVGCQHRKHKNSTRIPAIDFVVDTIASEDSYNSYCGVFMELASTKKELFSRYRKLKEKTEFGANYKGCLLWLVLRCPSYDCNLDFLGYILQHKSLIEHLKDFTFCMGPKLFILELGCREAEVGGAVMFHNTDALIVICQQYLHTCEGTSGKDVWPPLESGLKKHEKLWPEYSDYIRGLHKRLYTYKKDCERRSLHIVRTKRCEDVNFTFK